MKQLLLVCRGCKKAFSNLEEASNHGFVMINILSGEECSDRGYDIKTESEVNDHD